MKQSNDNRVFWGVIFLFICIFYIIRELAVERFLITHWVRVGFFLVLALRSLLLPLLHKRSRAALIQENDELTQFIRLKSYRAAIWASLLPLLLLGMALRSWGGSEELKLIGLGLLCSHFILLLIFLMVPSPGTVINLPEEGENL